MANASASGNTITGTSSSIQGGGVSSQLITSGDGYVEFTVSGTDGNRAAGLSNGNTNQDLADIDFAIRLNGGGAAEIQENEVYKEETTYATNDVFRVEIIGNQVKYKKNGAVFYTSTKTPTYPLLVDSAIYTQGSSISNAIISYGSSDTTPPTVSITAPTAGAAVSGTSMAVNANASDNVGVSGVQFKLDGSNLGSEDTSAPYSIAWNTTSTSNGSHTLSAVARDSAGNSTTSTGVSVTVNNTAPPTILFESNWSTATGNSDNALRDGGRWTWTGDFGGGQLLSVVPSTQVPGGPSVSNVLKVLQKGQNFSANVQVNDFVAPTTDYYLRYYMRNDDTSSAGDHIVTVDTYSYGNLTFMRKFGGSSSFKMYVNFFGCGYVYPVSDWSPSQLLNNGQWYRYEYFVHYVDATHIQVHPRVYDMAGNLILSDANFLQSDYGSQVWNGSNTWNLSSYYGAGYNFCVDPNARADAGGHSLRNFGLGNNGQFGADITNLSWYFAGVQIRTDTWPGPL